MTLREIDKLVATFVMQLEFCRCPENENGYSIHSYSADTGRCLGCRMRPASHYTSSPYCSRFLREKLAADGHTWNLLSPTVSVPEFGCVIDSQKDPNHFVETASTEELAVALCALKAKGVPIEAEEAML